MAGTASTTPGAPKGAPGAPPAPRAAKTDPKPQAKPQPQPQAPAKDTTVVRESSSTSLSASDAGGAFLAILVWGWVILPLIQGGPDRMRNVLRAKFFNKGPKGEWLP